MQPDEPLNFLVDVLDDIDKVFKPYIPVLLQIFNTFQILLCNEGIRSIISNAVLKFCK